jgi:NAD(P)-dependent dehydrogenase (short-subunit alcohol dehydrogenase family)
VQSPAPFIYLPEVPTEGYRNLGNEEQMAQFAAQMAAQIPLGRVGQPDEIVKAVVFLASDDNGISFSKRSRPGFSELAGRTLRRTSRNALMPNRDRVRMFNDIKNVPIVPALVTECS